MNAPDAADPRIGQVVAGRYRLISLIAEGGMGRVYRAEQVALQEPVVVKFLHAAIAREPVVRQRFRLEAKALIRLRHPGVVTIHDYGEHEGEPYIALELVEAPTLGARIAEVGRLPLPELFAVFDQLLDVLAATHAAGVIHRDLKPENVMVRGKPGEGLRVTVLDFGIARLTDDEGRSDPRLTGTGTVFGTPSFMAPEQCRGRGVGPAADVYSATVMLFLALTGELPFSAESSAELFAKQLYVAPPSLADRGAVDLPAGLEALVARGLAKKAVDRPSAADLRRELQQIAAADPGAAGRERRDREWQSREQRAAAVSPPRQATTPPALEPGRATVVLWGFPAARAAALVDALAVNGIRGLVLDDQGRPDGDDVVVIAGHGWEARLTRLRAGGGKLPPVMVADIAAAGDIPALVRAGVNDVALSTIADDVLASRLLRLIRRRR